MDLYFPYYDKDFANRLFRKMIVSSRNGRAAQLPCSLLLATPLSAALNERVRWTTIETAQRSQPSSGTFKIYSPGDQADWILWDGAGRLVPSEVMHQNVVGMLREA
eukprot:3091720-Amphidinium_carterae.3